MNLRSLVNMPQRMLEVGKEATMIATDGDPLEIRSTIERAWIAGREVDLTADRQKELYRKYEARPKPTAEPATRD